MTTVTIFKNAKTPTDPKYVSVDKLVEAICSGKWKDKIEQLNTLKTKKDQNEFKQTQLPGIVWQGRFSYRNDKSCTEHSGLVALDFDGLNQDELELLRSTLIDDPYTHILFISPRRNGLKMIVKIPPSIDDHKAHLSGLMDYHKNPHYDHFDDLSRLCFVSYDPDIYYNPDSKVWDTKPEAKETPVKSKTSIDNSLVAYSFNKLAEWADREYGYHDGNKHKHLVGLFSSCNVYGIPKDDALNMAYEKYSKVKGVEIVSFKDFQTRANSIYSLYGSDFATKVMDKPIPQQSTPATPAIPDPEPPTVTGKFPIEVFPKNIQEFIIELNKSLNYSQDFISTAMMSAIATINGNKYKLRVKNGWNAPTIFWFAVVGDPGTMKSHPVSTILSPINEIDEKNHAIHVHELQQWEFDKLANKGKPTTPKPQFKQIMISDITLESLHEVHSFNRRGLLYYKDELVGFLNDMDKYRKGSDQQFWLESFNNKSYIVNRVSKNVNLIEDAMINIIGTIQPTVVSKMAKDFSGNGLTDRFLYTGAEKNIFPLSNTDIDDGWLKWWKESLTIANTHFQYLDKQDSVIIPMKAGALNKLIEIDTRTCELQKSNDITESFKNYLSKSKTYLPRFALLVSLFDTIFAEADFYVTIDHIERADKIMQYYIQSAAKIFSDADKSNEMTEIVASKKGMTKSEQIVFLHQKGFKNIDIATQLVVAKSYVSRVISQLQK